MAIAELTVCASAGIGGAILTTLFGGWSSAMTTLCIFMGIDYFTGLVCAIVFKKSKKSENGGLDSGAAWKGLCKKCVTLLLVLMAYRLDIEAKTTYIKDAVCIAFIVSEGISILENAVLMGLIVPKPLRDALDFLKKGGKNDDEGGQIPDSDQESGK